MKKKRVFVRKKKIKIKNYHSVYDIVSVTSLQGLRMEFRESLYDVLLENSTSEHKLSRVNKPYCLFKRKNEVHGIFLEISDVFLLMFLNWESKKLMKLNDDPN